MLNLQLAPSKWCCEPRIRAVPVRSRRGLWCRSHLLWCPARQRHQQPITGSSRLRSSGILAATVEAPVVPDLQKLEQQLQNLQSPPPSGDAGFGGPISAADMQKLRSLRKSLGIAVPQESVQSSSNTVPQETDLLLCDGAEFRLLDDVSWKSVKKLLEIGDEYHARVSFLFRLGLRKHQFMKLRGDGQRCLNHNVAFLRTRIRSLRDEFNLPLSTVLDVLVKYPRIIEYRAETVLLPKVQWLTAQGIPREKIDKLFGSAPQIFALSINNCLAPKVDFYRRWLQLSDKDVAKLLTGCFILLGLGMSNMENKRAFLESYGFSHTQLRRLVLQHSNVMYYRAEAIQEKLTWLEGTGLSHGEVAQLVSRMPQLLSLRVDRMAPKLEYLRRALRLPVADLLLCPQYLALSLHGRIIPRHRFLQVTQPDKEFKLHYLFAADADFAVKFANSTPASYRTFMKMMSSYGATVGARE